jgi:uncharacterized protein (DUF2225 family)
MEAAVMNPLYLIKVNCIHCKISFQTSRVRPSQKKGTTRDSDFCIHYKDINPDFYVVRVCPFCGFAFSENFSNNMTERQQKNFVEKVSDQWKQHDYGGERTWDDAMKTYKLALICAQIKEEKDRIIAGLLQHIAWLYRYKNDKEQENRFLKFSLDAYIKVYELEGVDLNNARLMYLIGELHRRLKNYTEAVKWFTKVINDKKIMDAGMIRACREQWAVVREDMKKDADHTDDLKEN